MPGSEGLLCCPLLFRGTVEYVSPDRIRRSNRDRTMRFNEEQRQAVKGEPYPIGAELFRM